MLRFNGIVLAAIGMIGIAGCSGGNSDYKKTADLKKAPALHDHDHGEKGPHGGSIVELGKEEYHAEVVVDADAHAIRVFVMGSDAKTAQPTTATEVTVTPNGKDPLKLKPVPQPGDGEGKSSRFELVDDEAVHKLLDDGAIHGELQISIADKQFTGEVDYHLDDVHHDHKDEKPADGAKEGEKADAPKGDADKTDKAAETKEEPK